MSTEFQLQVLAELSEIKSVGAATAQRVESLEDRLFNGGSGVIHTLQDDIREIKGERASEARWNRVHNILHYSIGPLLVTAQTIARKFGMPI